MMDETVLLYEDMASRITKGVKTFRSRLLLLLLLLIVVIIIIIIIINKFFKPRRHDVFTNINRRFHPVPLPRLICIDTRDTGDDVVKFLENSSFLTFSKNQLSKSD